MGSEADVKPDDEFMRALLAVRNVGWTGGYLVGRDVWRKMIDELIAMARKYPTA